MTTAEQPHRRSVQYPESDGKPLGESDRHRILMTDLIFALSWYLRQTIAYVAGNLFLYFEAGNPRAVVATDVFVVRGVQPRERRTYKLWEEQVAPVVVIEVSDTGPGFPPRARENLFQAFSGSARPGGTGLGLAIAAELIRAHGGEIRLVEGTIGATFHLTIPDQAVDLDAWREELLAYWHLELTLGPPQSNWQASLRMHHRSTAYGLFGSSGGSNAVTLGVRYEFD